MTQSKKDIVIMSCPIMEPIPPMAPVLLSACLKEAGFSSIGKDLNIDFFNHFKDAMVNRRSTTWRNLSDEEREEAPLALLTEHPTLMKRPVIVDGDSYHLGWGKDVQAALL